MIATEKIFFELIQVAIGNRNTLSKNPTENEWKAIFDLANKQAVAGVAFAALEVLVNHGQKPSTDYLLQWIGLCEYIKNRNGIVNQRCKDLERFFVDNGFRCCVLKGQGTALYYNNPELRQSGDIDLWVAKDEGYNTDDVRSDVLQFAKSHGYQIDQIDIKHSDIAFFEDVPVEVHFMPSWMFNPFRNRKLQRFFREYAEIQFSNHNPRVGFTHTTSDFDVVFSLVHIYRHVFEEGIGLRQLLDYYYILQHTDKQQREGALRVLKSLGMSSFVGGVMYVLRECFLLNPDFMLCKANKRYGEFMLSEILIAGNFGHFDTRYVFHSKEERFRNGIVNLKRNFKYLFYYPCEVCWLPIWKMWHWCWRKRKGYL